MKTKAVVLGTLSVVCLFFCVNVVFGYNNGYGDEDMPTPSGSCSNGFGCHGGYSSMDKFILTSYADDGTWNTPGESGAIVCTLNIDGASSDADIAGIMLLNIPGDNIKDDGWTITDDPNSNTTPYNYNEQVCASGDYVYTWDVDAPTAGSYELFARMLLDDGGSAFDTSNVLDFNFGTGVSEDKSNVSTKAPVLLPNFPNPVCNRTWITYTIPREINVSLSIYDVTGKLIRTLVDGERREGSYTVAWDGTDISGKYAASGIYLYRLETVEFTDTKKLILLR